MAWNPPSAYSDGSILVPARDLDLYEIYVNDQGTFSPPDAPSAYVSAVDPATGQLETKFDFANLRPFLPPGIRYYVAMRSVDKAGSKSDFSPPAPFSF